MSVEPVLVALSCVYTPTLAGPILVDNIKASVLDSLLENAPKPTVP